MDMKRWICCLFLLVSAWCATAQDIVYSDYNNEDDRDINFEILGKQGKNYVVYKRVRWKHLLAFYDENMKMVKSMRMAFIPEKSYSLNFITYPDYFYVVYQYQKNNIVYAKMARLDNSGNILNQPVVLDTTKVLLKQERDLYTTTFSENKKHILLYKNVLLSNSRISIATRSYDDSFALRDSTRLTYPFDDRYDVFSDFIVDNQGAILMGKGKIPAKKSSLSSVELISKQLNKPTVVTDIPLQKHYVDEFKLKVDNKNGQYIINSFYYKERKGDIEGIFMAAVHYDDEGKLKYNTVFHPFSDSLRVKINSGEQYKTAFNDLFIKNIIVTKDGGFLVAAESARTENSGNRSFNRYDYYGNPIYSQYDYYSMNASSFNSYYRPYSSSSLFQNTRYYYDDILILSVNNKLSVEWTNIIPKKQVDDGNDNYLSFAMFNTGGEIHFLFLEKDKNLQVINNHSVLPGGEMKRYATLKSREAGYQFMPKLARQVGYNKIIIPCIYRGYVCFAKVEFE